MTVRVPKELRDQAHETASRRNENLSDVIREFLQEYVDRNRLT